ncbi:sensor histidine kinase [Blautia difficilis]|uniref:histidine kinase n=1 Tax=Blautia difficilis TaxID=2763027 RepID=A0ABR7IJY8_9FIRM|nr:ATP-binding protein [Blautia difficilis]MBC5780329.1 two-component sensor histidine kinase [Blautia difficilis]
MKQKIFSHTSLLIILSVILTFLAAGTVMYNRYDIYMKQGIRDEAAYIKTGLEEDGDVFLSDRIGDVTSSRITLLGKDGQVLFDSIENPEEMENHSNRPEFIEAEKQGSGEMVRYSDTLSKQTFYYAVKLKDDQVLRVARTTDSLLLTMLTSFLLLGGLVCVILVIELFLVQKQTRKLIEPINRIDLEHPLEYVCYEELRPLLFRLDQQNRQIQKQLEDLKSAESARKEFTANVSHELKTPLMSISGYAELMMNGMVPQDKMQDFSGRIYHESERLSNLVADIIQLSRLDEKNGETMFEPVDLGELGEDVINNLQNRAAKKKIRLEYTGDSAQIQGVRHVLYEMFYNLTDNAIRYTPESGEVKVFVGKLNGKPYFRVEDNGIGIPENEQQRIFERFYRVDKSHSRETGGTGLGLSIVKHGAALHHAKILLDSEPGRGTKMEILFNN